MNYTKVSRMAKYYYALQLIAIDDFSYASACNAVGVCPGDLCRMYKNTFSFMTDRYPNMITILSTVLKRHSSYPHKSYPPKALSEVHIDDGFWDELEEEVSKWPYYDNKPYAIEQWKKERLKRGWKAKTVV